MPFSAGEFGHAVSTPVKWGDDAYGAKGCADSVRFSLYSTWDWLGTELGLGARLRGRAVGGFPQLTINLPLILHWDMEATGLDLPQTGSLVIFCRNMKMGAVPWAPQSSRGTQS